MSNKILDLKILAHLEYCWFQVKKLFYFIKSEVVEVTELCSIKEKNVWSSYKLVWNEIKVNVSQRETDVHLPIAREWVGGLLGAAFQHLQGGNQEDKAKLFTQMLRGRTDNSHPPIWGRFHLDLIRGKITYYGVD